MRCLDENSVAALFEQQIAAEDMAAIDKHVQDCDRCRRVLSTYADLFFGGDATLMATVVTPPPSDLPSQVDGRRADSILSGWLARFGPARRVGNVIKDKWVVDKLL